MTTCVHIARYLRPLLKDIETHYTWSFDEKIAEKISGVAFSKDENPLHKTAKLKHALGKKLRESQEQKLHYDIGKYIITTWGKITNHKALDEIIASTRKRAMGGRENFKSVPLTGVSSWSKYLSLLHSWAPVYDSRVAYAINAINLISGNTTLFYAIPNGRGSRLTLIDIETFFVIPLLANKKITVQDLQHSQFSAKSKEQFHIRPENTYDQYCKLLEAVALELKDEIPQSLTPYLSPSQIIEALLFAIAPTKVLADLITFLAAGASPPASAG
ncbi:hypothetical protein [Pseudomonas sp. D2002]|uniref:hypothetical protein n=1 Tax=Pseudomonas sp. D2002 TaxID=2726980 RepID=UPI0015A475D5|nr:hypothetical protein [Pseudomonas sp. D2002]NWA84292.1 hypothetical protein [Pseudomonas sp. D2002]